MKTRALVNVGFAAAAFATWVAFEFTGREVSRELLATLAAVITWTAPDPGGMAERAKKVAIGAAVLAMVLLSGCGALGQVAWQTAVSCGSEVSATLVESVGAILKRNQGPLSKDDWRDLGKLAKERTPSAVQCTVKKLLELWTGGFSASSDGTPTPEIVRAREFLAKTSE